MFLNLRRIHFRSMIPLDQRPDFNLCNTIVGSDLKNSKFFLLITRIVRVVIHPGLFFYFFLSHPHILPCCCPPHLQSAPRWHLPRRSLKPPCYPKPIQHTGYHSTSTEKRKKETHRKHIVGSVIAGNKP